MDYVYVSDKILNISIIRKRTTRTEYILMKYFIKIKRRLLPLLFSVFYCKPNTSRENKIQIFSEIASEISPYDKVIIFGDLNTNILMDTSSPLISEIEQITKCTQKVHSVTTRSGTAIDICLSNIESKTQSQNTIKNHYIEWSHHMALSTLLSLT